MSSPGELMNETLEEYLDKELFQEMRVDTHEWMNAWDLRELGRGPHCLPIIKNISNGHGFDECQVGKIEFEFIVNPDADGDRESFYIVKEDSVILHLYPNKLRGGETGEKRA